MKNLSRLIKHINLYNASEIKCEKEVYYVKHIVADKNMTAILHTSAVEYIIPILFSF